MGACGAGQVRRLQGIALCTAVARLAGIAPRNAWLYIIWAFKRALHQNVSNAREMYLYIYMYTFRGGRERSKIKLAMAVIYRPVSISRYTEAVTYRLLHIGVVARTGVRHRYGSLWTRAGPLAPRHCPLSPRCPTCRERPTQRVALYYMGFKRAILRDLHLRVHVNA